MNFTKYFLFFLMAFCLSGCYAAKAKKTYEQLKLGSSKQQLDELFKDLKFIKEQAILPYHENDEKKTLGYIWQESYKDIQPSMEIIHSFTFDGNIKVYNYFVDEKSNWPNPPIIYYIAVFYNKSADKVIAKAIMTTIVSSSNWGEKF